MNKNIKRIIATTLVVCAFSAIEPVQYMNLTTTKAYASSNKDKRDKKDKKDRKDRKDRKDKFNKDNFDDLKVNEESGSDKIQLYSKSNCKSDDETDFDFSDTAYYAKVSKGTSSVNITADNDSDYEVYVFKGNNKKKYDLGDEIDIDSGTTTLYVRAYKDGDFDKDSVKRDVKKTYTIYVKNGSSSSSDSDTTDEDKDQDDIYLDDLRLSEGKIDFSKDKTSYDVNVKESIDEIKITAKPEDEDYTVKIDGSKVDDGDNYKKTVELKKGKNAIEVSIKNGSDKRIYTLNINRGTTSSSTNTTENNKPATGDNNITVDRPTQSNKKAQQWVTVNGKWQYNDISGNPLKSAWLRDKNSGKWYFLDADANMATGWLYTSGVWYYLDNSGAMQTGWLQLNGKWYYLDTNGVMRTQWIKVDGKYYYLNESGVMRYDTIINGYKLDASGAWIG